MNTKETQLLCVVLCTANCCKKLLENRRNQRDNNFFNKSIGAMIGVTILGITKSLSAGIVSE